VRRRGIVGSFWPTKKQELLLRAALARRDEDVLSAWRELQPLDVEVLEEEVFGALPPLYRRLRELVPDDPRLARLSGTYRKTWYRNQLQLSRLAAELAAARESGRRPLVVGDAARATYYPELGLRPIIDPGLLLEPGQAPSYVFPSNRAKQAEELWRAAREVAVGETALPVPDPADQLLFVVGLGARKTWPASVQWLVDLHAIVSSQAVDHGRLIENLAANGLLTPARDALGYVAMVSGDEQVEALRDRTASRVPTRRDSIAHRLAGTVSPTLGHYVRATSAQPLTRAAIGLPRFLQDAWELERGSEVPVAALKRAFARLRL
jgi:hypothetical protein